MKEKQVREGKRCPQCGEWKLYSEFHHNRRQRDGHQPYCKPCWNAKVAVRRAANLDAERARVRLYQRRYVAKDPETQHKRYQDWYEEHGREYHKHYRAAHPEQSQAAVRRWQSKENNSSNAIRRRRASKVGNGGSHTEAEWQSLAASYEFCCAACGKCPSGIWPDVLCRDHVVPLTLGGTDDISNIQPLCNLCNVTKGNRHSTDHRK